MLQEIAIASLKTIDLVFFVPMCDALRHAGTTLEPPNFRAQIDAALPVVARELGVEIVTIEGDPVERTAKAFSLVAGAAHGTFNVPQS
jgi:hypothetical protein